MLVNRLVLPERRSRERTHRHVNKGQVVFLLGAGCSRQYGLANFKELLTYIWQDNFRCPPDSSWSLEMLRDELDKNWQATGPGARKETLKFYLDRVEGKHCLGYLRLAQLAKDGYVKAFINMNFDTLLEDALYEVKQDYKVSTGFSYFDYPGLIVYKPHGSIGKVHHPKEIGRSGSSRFKNELILDIANSDMFADPEEQKFVQNLLTAHDVVTIGYSGIDAKIAAALRGFPASDSLNQKPASDPSGEDSDSPDPRDQKLFYVNVSPPDPRLLLVMAERSSQNLSILGEDGSFENFAEMLVQAVQRAST